MVWYAMSAALRHGFAAQMYVIIFRLNDSTPNQRKIS